MKNDILLIHYIFLILFAGADKTGKGPSGLFRRRYNSRESRRDAAFQGGDNFGLRGGHERKRPCFS